MVDKEQEFDLETLRQKIDSLKQDCEKAIAAIDSGKVHRLAQFQPDSVAIQRIIGRLLG